MKNKEQKQIELKEFEWEAPEFKESEKEKSWFVMPLIIAIIFAAFAVITENFLFLILIILSFIVFYNYAKKSPRLIRFKINEKGIEVDGIIHEYGDLRSFWIFYDPPLEKILSIRSKKRLLPYIRIPLDKENPAEIRSFLLKFLPEKKHKESIIDIWMKKIGF